MEESQEGHLATLCIFKYYTFCTQKDEKPSFEYNKSLSQSDS
jgi:hypothetical protein